MIHKIFALVIGPNVPQQPGASLEYDIPDSVSRQMAADGLVVVSHAATSIETGLLVTLYCASASD